MENKYFDDTKLGTRDKKGNWKPNGKIPVNPPGVFPFNPLKFFKDFIGWPGYFFPYQMLFMGITILTYFFLTPPLEQMKNLELGWISFILFRNALIIFLWTGAFHLKLKYQGSAFKYNPKPLETNSSRFLFNNQTLDNMFWTFCSAIPIWTAYEVITFWAFANNIIPIVSWEMYPVYCCVLFFLIPFIRDGHFYFVHRLLHWKPLYKFAHKTHHLNTNTGAWSGVSMHWFEHILYFSGILIHWIIPSHPLIAMFHVFHAGIAPTAGHTGYERMVFKKGQWIPCGDYNHYLHHKLFECNYAGGGMSFFDKIFGTFHNGSEESDLAFREKRKSRRYL